MKLAVKNSKRRRSFHRYRKVVYSLVLVMFVAFGVVVYSVIVYSKRDLFVSPLSKVKAAVKDALDPTDTGRKKLAQELRKNDIQFTVIDMPTSDVYSVKLKDNGEVLFSSQKDITSQIASLQVIYIRLTMEGKRFTKLDLRFDKPVIVLK